ncbi:MAG: hypothetical protein ACP5D5_02510 [Acidithiobacillus sp.]|uniref:hypothetical protein n=1 Tax=Acidithiobacillus sp. TaxID=1872118 RepID=UPI0025B8E1DC|nr:hypothetical protein [Acidithiobacillus sp.]
MLFLVRPLHRWAKKYRVAHHHLLLVWCALSLVIPAITLFAALGVNFSSTAQALSLFVLGVAIGVFFYILLLAEEARIAQSSH